MTELATGQAFKARVDAPSLRNDSVGISGLAFVGAEARYEIVRSACHVESFTHFIELTSAIIPQPIALEQRTPPPSPPRSFVFRFGNSGRTAMAEILRQLAEEPIEDGVAHPAEQSVEKYLRTHGDQHVAQALKSLSASEAASLARLLGRAENVGARMREQVLAWGLASSSVELRDAAIQAAENWGDARLAPLLRAHLDDVPWLAKYAADVARDLEG